MSIAIRFAVAATSLLFGSIPAGDAAGLIRSWPRRLAMLEGIDATFAAAVFLGYHEKEGTASAVLAHTFNMPQFYSIRLDDREVGSEQPTVH